MKVAEIMLPTAVRVSPQMTLFETAQTMKVLGIGMLPVCERDRLVGIVTDRDITIRAVARGWDPRQTSVGEVMTEETIYCFDDQEVAEAAGLMRDYEVRRLPVLNREKRLVGIISLGDLAACRGNEALAGAVLGRITIGALAMPQVCDSREITTVPNLRILPLPPEPPELVASNP